MVEKSLPVYSLYFILPLVLVAFIRSIFVSKISVQRISDLKSNIEVTYQIFNTFSKLKCKKEHITFLDLEGYRGSFQRINFIVNSKKEFTQYFVGQFNTSEFDLLNSDLMVKNSW
ncbi:hypothetical protein [Algoriphagus winogradskyi]|nr:hypothetical protein [Algoriphagus winogradskyi]